MINDNFSFNDILSLPSVNFFDKWQLPEIPAIYFVVKLPNTILYIGQTKNLLKRIKTHNYTLQFERHCNEYKDIESYPSVYYLDCNGLSESERVYYEYKCISLLPTMYNKSGTLENDLKIYFENLSKFLLTLTNGCEKQLIINYINQYAHQCSSRQNPLEILLTANKVKILDYEIIKNKNEIIK